MELGTRNLLIGCGIGCGLLILALLAVGGGGFLAVKGMLDKAERVEAASDALQARFGAVGDFRPAADGSIAPERLEAFLAVRRRLADERAVIADRLASLAEAKLGVLSGSPGKIIRTVRAGAGLVPHILDYVTARNEALSATGVAPGEYLYLYALAYYVDLGYSPGDGPPFILTDDDDRSQVARDRFDPFDGEAESEAYDTESSPDRIRDLRNRRIRRQLNRQLLPMLTNQLADLRRDGGTAGDRWSEELEREIAALQAEPLRLPWQDGLPRQLSQSFAPYRARLRADYCELCNPLEVLGIAEP